MPLASHVELPERYRVTRHVASGGMASVWEVEDLLLGRIVAVKVLGAHYALDPGARERFQREARTAAQVSDHPHVATIYDIGEHGDCAFIVMEYFSGGTVADRLRTAREGGRRVPARTTLRWLREAAAGLDVAHTAGIVHRDVKPANLLLDAQDRLAVGDFGIARLADDTHMTQTGQVLGTAAYLSPEQALGKTATAASDRYALAVVAYELLTGQRPFEAGPPQAQLRQHAETPPPRASDTAPELPVAVDLALLRGLAKNPDDRPATATALVDDIEQALTSPAQTVDRTVPLAPVQARKATPPRKPPRAPAAPIPPRQATRARAAPIPPREPARPPAAPISSRQPEPAAPRRSPLLVLLAIAALLAGGAVAFALAGSDSPEERSAGSSPAATQKARTSARSSTTTPATSEPQPAATAPVQAAAAPSTDPSDLNAEGFELIKAGRYGEAVEPLQASVQGYREAGKTDDVNYAYALYNLGVALNRSGNPTAAVEVLQERLKYNNQRGTVQAELDDALAQLGRKPGKAKGRFKGGDEGDDG